LHLATEDGFYELFGRHDISSIGEAIGYISF
ncbi:MAG: hypothetical protein HW378_976, partial [Anaerolineales bacterium]|nr:hypothetical protein [Anaerolineales bacterium]MBM2849689.1 hypothetical protein [Anaerolineales bacterium]